MTYDEFRALREKIERARESCEEWMDVDTATLDAWSSGRERIPRVRARQMTWLGRFVEREHEMELQGITECEWAGSQRAWGREQDSDDVDAAQAHLEDYLARLDKHAESCTICQRRRAYWETHPLPAFPTEGVFGSVIDLIQGFWLRWAARKASSGRPSN